MVVGHVTGAVLFTLSSHSSGSLFVGLFCKARPSVQLWGKVRNQNPAEQLDVDTDKLDVSLSVCRNDIDARVGSRRGKVSQVHAVALPLCCRKEVGSLQVCFVKCEVCTIKI